MTKSISQNILPNNLSLYTSAQLCSIYTIRRTLLPLLSMRMAPNNVIGIWNDHCYKQNVLISNFYQLKVAFSNLNNANQDGSKFSRKSWGWDKTNKFITDCQKNTTVSETFAHLQNWRYSLHRSRHHLSLPVAEKPSSQHPPVHISPTMICQVNVMRKSIWLNPKFSA